MQHATRKNATRSMQHASCTKSAGLRAGCVAFSNLINATAATATIHQRHRNDRAMTRHEPQCTPVLRAVSTAAARLCTDISSLRSGRWVDRTALLNRSIYSADELNEWPEE
jgi:hypothetical protein